MTLQSALVPDPPAGFDWVTAVPGIYLYDIRAVQARLTNLAGPNSLIDFSGNGHNGFYVPVSGVGFPALVAGLVAGDGARQFADAGAVNAGFGDIPACGVDFAGPFTIEFLVASFPGGTPNNFLYAGDDFAGNVVTVAVGNTGKLQMQRNSGIFQDVHETAAGAIPYDNAGHHIAVTFDGVTALLYVDGAPVPWVVDQPAVAMASGTFEQNVGWWNLHGSPIEAIMDESATYNQALTAVQVTAHFLAIGGGIATYSGAVLADSPVTYYHLGAISAGGRTPGFGVTDGTHLLADIDDGFPAAVAGNVFDYTWSVGLTANTQSQGGAQTTVGLPRLLLPGGYTIGTLTPDLQPSDQWSGIEVWWDDSYQQAVNLPRYAYPPGVFLQYRQQEAVAP